MRRCVTLDDGSERFLWMVDPRHVLGALLQRMHAQGVAFDQIKPQSDK